MNNYFREGKFFSDEESEVFQIVLEEFLLFDRNIVLWGSSIQADAIKTEHMVKWILHLLVFKRK